MASEKKNISDDTLSVSESVGFSDTDVLEVSGNDFDAAGGGGSGADGGIGGAGCDTWLNRSGSGASGSGAGGNACGGDDDAADDEDDGGFKTDNVLPNPLDTTAVTADLTKNMDETFATEYQLVNEDPYVLFPKGSLEGDDSINPDPRVVTPQPERARSPFGGAFRTASQLQLDSGSLEGDDSINPEPQVVTPQPASLSTVAIRPTNATMQLKPSADTRVDDDKALRVKLQVFLDGLSCDEVKMLPEVYLGTLSRERKKRLTQFSMEDEFDRPGDTKVDKNWNPNSILPNGQTAKEYVLEWKRKRGTFLSPFAAMEILMLEHPTLFKLELHDSWNPEMMCGDTKALYRAIWLCEYQSYSARNAVVCVMFEYIGVFYIKNPIRHWDIGTPCGPKKEPAFKIGKRMIKNGEYLDALEVARIIMRDHSDSFDGQEKERDNQLGQSEENDDSSGEGAVSRLFTASETAFQHTFDLGVIKGRDNADLVREIMSNMSISDAASNMTISVAPTKKDPDRQVDNASTSGEWVKDISNESIGTWSHANTLDHSVDPDEESTLTLALSQDDAQPLPFRFPGIERTAPASAFDNSADPPHVAVGILPTTPTAAKQSNTSPSVDSARTVRASPIDHSADPPQENTTASILPTNHAAVKQSNTSPSVDNARAVRASPFDHSADPPRDNTAISILSTNPAAAKISNTSSSTDSKAKKKKTKKKRKKRVLYKSRTFKTDRDILYGRGKNINAHPGNIYFRQIATGLRSEYMQSSKQDKPNVAKRFIQIIKGESRRFLEKKDGQWYEVKDGVFTKASQTMRDVQNHPQL